MGDVSQNGNMTASMDVQREYATNHHIWGSKAWKETKNPLHLGVSQKPVRKHLIPVRGRKPGLH